MSDATNRDLHWSVSEPCIVKVFDYATGHKVLVATFQGQNADNDAKAFIYWESALREATELLKAFTDVNIVENRGDIIAKDKGDYAILKAQITKAQFFAARAFVEKHGRKG